MNFSWDEVFADLKHHTPSLVKLLQMINPKAANNHALISIWIAMMIKCRKDKLSLVQRVFSVFLYGKAVHKEVQNSIIYIYIYISDHIFLGVQTIATIHVVYVPQVNS